MKDKDLEKDIKHLRALAVDTKEAIDEARFRILATVSSSVIDRDDEIVTAEAVLEAINRKDEFSVNPICLPQHIHRLDSGMPACVGSWDTATAKIVSKDVRMWLEFAAGTKLGDEYWKYYSKKHMKAFSIGFRALEWHMEDNNGKQIRVITKIELYEISCVTVPSNRRSVSLHKGIDEKFAYQILESYQAEIDGKEVTVVTKMEPINGSTDMTVLKSFIHDELEDQFDRLKLYLGNNPDGPGDLPLGDDPIPSVEEQKAEDMLNIFADLVQQKLKGK